MNHQPDTARALLWRHGLPEDVIDGALALHAQELAAVQRKAHDERRPYFHMGMPCTPGYDCHVAGLIALIMPGGAEESAGVAPAPDQTALRVVAYRSPGTRALYCVICARQEEGWTPLTADQVLEGVLCDFCCGRIHDVASRALGSIVARYVDAPGQTAPSRRAGLRDEIAAALYAHDHPGHVVPLHETGMGPAYQESADAVLPVLYREWPWLRAEAEDAAVLPASVDRADVLREEAARIRAHCPDHLDADSAEGSWMVCHCDVADDMERRAAAEPPAEAHPPTTTWKVESPRRDTWASWGATYDERGWAQERYESAIESASARPFRLVRATTTHTVEAKHAPAAAPAAGGAPQPKEG